MSSFNTFIEQNNEDIEMDVDDSTVADQMDVDDSKFVNLCL